MSHIRNKNSLKAFSLGEDNGFTLLQVSVDIQLNDLLDYSPPTNFLKTQDKLWIQTKK